MGLIKAAIDGLSSTFADQWRDFYTVPGGLAPTAALFAAVPQGTNVGRGSNSHASTGVITNGTKMIIPEGYGLILMQDGAITGFAAEAGGYEWQSEAQDSQSMFAGEFLSPLVVTSWERFKFGGRPHSQQQAFFVSLKELPNNKFGTVSEIYWDDSYVGAQVGATARGTYTARIVDPILFVKNFVPAKYLQPGIVFDFTDLENDASSQLFNEVVSSLAPAFARYTNDPANNNRISKIQQDSLGFAQSLSAAVESAYGWRTQRGLEIVSSAIISIEYDESTQDLLKTVQRADALLGARGNSNLQASVAAGLQSAGESDGSSGMLGIGIAAGASGLGTLQQPTAGAPPTGEPSSVGEDPVATLTKFKLMLDAGLITQDEYDAAKRKALGL